MKNLEQLEQEAKQAREELYIGMLGYFPLNPEVANDITNKIIEAAVAMVTYQFALAAQEQEVQDDGWIEVDGVIPLSGKVQAKLTENVIITGLAEDINWMRVIAYRRAK